MKHVTVLILSLSAAASLLLGCAVGSRQLQSIAVHQVVSGGKVQFTATGIYSGSPAAVTPLPVSWGIGPFAPPPRSVQYTLTTQPYVFTCPGAGSGPLLPVSVLAPADPNAPMSGILPWKDVVTAYAQIQCP